MGNRRPERLLRPEFYQVTGDGHSGVSRSALGNRLRVPAADGRAAAP
jgi:hypothetical protein